MLHIYLSLLDTEREKQSFTTAYHAYRHEALYAAFRITKNQAIAEDALHNAFLEIIEKHRDYLELPGKKLRSKLINIVRFKAIDLMRKEKYSIRPERDIDEIDSSTPSAEGDLSVALASEEGYETIKACIKSLGDIYKIAFQLRYVHGKTNSEIAEIVGTTEKNASKRVRKAVGMLRDMLIQEGYRYDGE